MEKAKLQGANKNQNIEGFLFHSFHDKQRRQCILLVFCVFTKHLILTVYDRIFFCLTTACFVTIYLNFCNFLQTMEY